MNKHVRGLGFWVGRQLGRSEHLSVSQDLIDPALSAQLVATPTRKPISVERFIQFHRHAATFPWRSQAAWISARLAARYGIDRHHALTVGRACFRSDLYRANLSGLGIDLPGASEKVEGALAHPTAVASTRGEMILGPDKFFDGACFDNTPEAPPKF